MSQKKILVIFPKGLGDTVFASGVLSRLVKEEVGARFHLVFMHKAAASLFAHVPRLDGIHTVPYQRYKAHWLKLLQIGWAHHWYRVVDGRRSILSYLVYAQHRHRFVLNRRLHKIEQNARLMGYTPAPRPKLWLTSKQCQKGLALLPKGRPVLAVSPKSNQPPKNWDIQHFIATLKKLREQDGPLHNAVIALHGHPDGLMRKAFQMAFGQHFVDLSHQALDVVAASFLRTRLMLSNDSGLAHIAAAMGTPVLTLFGPKSEAQFAPQGRFSKVLRGRTPQALLAARAQKYPEQSAMGELDPHMVVHAANQLLNESKSWQCA